MKEKRKKEYRCEHKWSRPVVAQYQDFNMSEPLFTYDAFISCENCGEIKKVIERGDEIAHNLKEDV